MYVYPNVIGVSTPYQIDVNRPCTEVNDGRPGDSLQGVELVHVHTSTVIQEQNEVSDVRRNLVVP